MKLQAAFGAKLLQLFELRSISSRVKLCRNNDRACRWLRLAICFEALQTLIGLIVEPYLREKYREGVEVILRAWSEPDVFSFNGKYTKLRYVNLWPKPLQQPRPPIWIPGGGSVETYDFCADHDYQYSFLSYFGYIAGKKVADGWPEGKRGSVSTRSTQALKCCETPKL